jgi:hypothetical protein
MVKVQLVIKCPKSGCGDTPLRWQWARCSHSSLLDDDGDVRRFVNTSRYGALPVTSITSLQKLALIVGAPIMEQNMCHFLRLPFWPHYKEGLIQLTALVAYLKQKR